MPKVELEGHGKLKTSKSTCRAMELINRQRSPGSRVAVRADACREVKML